MRSLLKRWLDHYDPIYRGCSRAGIANGLLATGGFFFPRVAGGYNLYVSVEDPEHPGPDEAAGYVVGATSPAAANGRIAPFHTVTLPSAKVLWFWMHTLSPGGAEERHAAPCVRVVTDVAGSPAGLAPAPPAELVCEPIAGGNVRLAWRPGRAGETRAASYRVYHDAGTGTIDYVTPAAAVTQRYAELGPYADRTCVRFVVRAVAADGTEETNRDAVEAIADAIAPPDAVQPDLYEGVET